MTRSLFIVMLCTHAATTTALINTGENEVPTTGGENAPPGESEQPPTPATPVVPNLHSLPGAPATLFLDFDGHYQEERVGMNELVDDILVPGDHGWDHILTPPFDRPNFDGSDSDPLIFTAKEQQEIRFIWASVAEDYAPFNIDVTTFDPDPGVYHPERPYLRVVISGAEDFRGDGKGGFSDYDEYAGDGPNVAYVFSLKKDGQPISTGPMAWAASHEPGHLFGLRHYGKNSGNGSWAPIMRSTTSDATRTTWWYGVIGTFVSGKQTYNIYQNDMDIIAEKNGFGYRPDDHANSCAGASGLTMTNAGLFGHGVIEKTEDVDTFRFLTGGGDNFFIGVDLPKKAVTSIPVSIGNLDAVLRLYDANCTKLEEDNPSGATASLNPSLPAGTYYVKVSSNGAPGDVGQYSLQVAGETNGPRIFSSEYVSFRPPSTTQGVVVTFNEPINPYSFTPGDVRINGGADVVSVDPHPSYDSRVFTVTFTNPTNLAQINVSVGPDITDFFGNRMDQNQNGIPGESSDYYSASFGVVEAAQQ